MIAIHRDRHKGKNDPKDQRRPRQRNPAGPVEKKVEDKKDNDSKGSQKPLYEEPGPEFYKNLKRETDDILKITEEENSKYKKKEIQSNWSKYEMPIESYDEIQEQENMGADYEKLSEAPLAIGGHFQFKHEKSWDVDLGPSPYDKYFEFNMDNLFLSISTIPFNERNNFQNDIFTETDILNMKNRATRAKQKYYNDKSTKPKSDLSILQDDLDNTEKIIANLKSPTEDSKTDLEIDEKEIRLEGVSLTETKLGLSQNVGELMFKDNKPPSVHKAEATDKNIDRFDDLGAHKAEATDKNIGRFDDLDRVVVLLDNKENTVEDHHLDVEVTNIDVEEISKVSVPESTAIQNKKDTQSKPIIESPEDLEKWLDDFLED